MRDPYDVLGVPKSASAGDIKSAFRKLAKKLHPDANKNDPKAATQFAELNSAYEIVGDEDKRKQFDRGEIDAEGKPRFQGFEGFGGRGGARGGNGFEQFHFRTGGGPGGGGFQGFGGGLDDLLKGVFGGGGGGGTRARAQQFEFEGSPFAEPTLDVNATLTVSLEEAVNGAQKRVRLPTGKELNVRIPAGVTSGQQIRLKGQGQEAPGYRPGDALITVTIAPHPVFRLDGNDLRIDLAVTLYEAVLGGKVRVPTLQGAVELAIPRNTTSGRTFRLKGKGLSAKGATGDLFATVRIALPDGADADLEALMRHWQADKPYNPRGDH
ncbi:MAG: J domain-containing protein [Xanthobacteraceae bacterium]|nr:MAG: J domain-containing protein [Xanthobacteraceae bacterium]